MSLESLQHQLRSARTGVTDARAHTGRAKALLEESRRVLTDAQAVAQPWVPPQLAQAIESIERHEVRLAGVDDAIERYAARL